MAQHHRGAQLGQRLLHPGQLVFKRFQAGHVLVEAGEGEEGGGITSARIPWGRRGRVAPPVPLVHVINELISGTKLTRLGLVRKPARARGASLVLPGAPGSASALPLPSLRSSPTPKRHQISRGARQRRSLPTNPKAMGSFGVPQAT